MALLDGKSVAQSLRKRIKEEVQTYVDVRGRAPGLAVIRVGNDEASRIYVKKKIKACQEVGLRSISLELSDRVTQETLLEKIDMLNQDEDIDGILVQLPLPNHIDRFSIFDHIHPDKDVDGFTPSNVGRLIAGRNCFVPCTPKGIMHLLDTYNIEVKGKNAVVIGRSDIVGKPMAHLLLQKDATVTICHSRTQLLDQIVQEADILVAAVGDPGLVKGKWIKQGATVIDVGMNRLKDGRLSGDVVFDEAKDRAAWITPVPGGVGPLTIAMLLANTLMGAEKKEEVLS